MVIVLAVAAAAGLLFKSFLSMRDKDPQRAADLTMNIQSAATLVGAVASAISMLLGAFWGKPAQAVQSGNGASESRFGANVSTKVIAAA